MTFRTFAALTLALSLSTATAFAQTAAPVAAPATSAVDSRAVCKADMDKLCPGVERGEARRTCIDTNKDKFSAACTTARAADQERRQAFRAACADDAAKLCAAVDKSQGRATVECIRTHADKLTPACKTQLSQLPEPVSGDKAAVQK